MHRWPFSRRSAAAKALASAVLSSVITTDAFAGSGAPVTDVVATIKPVHALVQLVMGDAGTPKLLVGGSASPHTYALKPSDARALHSAKLVFRVSEQIEPFTRKILTSLPKTVTVVTLAKADGISLLPRRSGDAFESHDHSGDAHGHDHHGHEGHGHVSRKTGPGQDGDHDPEGHDGHVWLDPDNAKAMIGSIASALSAAYPEQAQTFSANAEAARKDIDALTVEIATTVETVKGKPYIVFHDAYQYFETRFGVPALGSITVSPEVQPSAKRLAAIRKKIRELGASCVFAEPQFKSKLIQTVIEGTGARAGTLDPEGAAIGEGRDAYATLLRNLAKGLVECLGHARSRS